ncbi:carbamoyltransferase [Streptomyces hygroscopicus subsp. hygroscopicus]|uniref:carbamoyltransferase family protein n=1 Tax=Streptomyces sp. KHY 26 TaxID=3097359 RepID=UPI0024A47B20|nr:carbamoyltransferase C-terminal domain-containing protein [Streptomyces hygroscopicus]GLX50948.1 carbamoyltransferase [Streptomyces hygroscopicus subsp. hygroscopicus]
MIVLGLSGLPHAQDHLLANTADPHPLDVRNVQGLDSAACLMVDGRVVAAAAEERFDGDKGTGRFPAHAIDYVLRAGGIGRDQVHAIAHGFAYDRHRRVFAASRDYFDSVLSGRTVIEALGESGWGDVAGRFHPVDHHVAHAASAYYPSGYDSALCVVSDGMGETESLSVYQARDGHLKKLHTQPISQSLGFLYSICTRFLGFASNSDEYKVMGLAAYGDPEPYRRFFERLVTFDDATGSVRVDWPNGALRAPESGYPRAMRYLEEAAFPSPTQSGDVVPEHADFAAALQARLTEVLVSLVSHWLDRTGETSLCLAGGTFLNCKANQSICDLPAVERVFAQPASGDDGTALGAAAHVSHREGSRYVGDAGGFQPYTGPSYTADEVRDALVRRAGGVDWTYVGLTPEYYAAAARDIAEDRIIAWFHGRMEFGPRALGNRSILGLPKGDRIKERINSLVKFREPFRPFAPAVLAEDRDRIFTTRAFAPTRYMLCTAGVREEQRDAVSGIVHADGTARIQDVREEYNSVFWSLLKAVKERTGTGCVVNTSFNVKGQPLIMDPSTAIDTFLRTSLDRLYIEGFVVRKP